MGRGAFGHAMPVDQHVAEALGRIVKRGRLLTEDAVFLFMSNDLCRNNQSQIFRKVRVGRVVGGYGYFELSPDVDLLEVCPSGTVVGYELNGYRRAGKLVEALVLCRG